MPVLDKTVEELNGEKVQLYIPTIVFIVIMMSLGIFGNSMVLFVYTFKIKRRSTYRLFVLMLATVDMTASCVGMPGLLANLLRIFTFYSNSACKMLRYGYHVIISASSMTHLLIGLERHRKICRPLQKQISLAMAESFLFVIVILSLITAVPAILFYGRHTVVERHTNITVSLCHTETYYMHTSYPLAYDITLLTFLILTILLLFLLYVLIARQVCKSSNAVRPLSNRLRTTIRNKSVLNRSKGNSQNFNTMLEHTDRYSVKATKDTTVWNQSTHSQAIQSKANTILHTGINIDLRTSNMVHGSTSEKGRDLAITEIEANDTDNPDGSQVPETRSETETTKDEGSYRTSARNSNERNSSSNLQKYGRLQTALSKRSVPNSRIVVKHSRKVTTVSSVITFAFIISYIPHFILTIGTSISRNHYLGISAAQEPWFKIGVLSYIINSAFNPFIYFVMDKDFKIQCHQFVSKICSRLSKK